MILTIIVKIDAMMMILTMVMVIESYDYYDVILMVLTVLMSMIRSVPNQKNIKIAASLGHTRPHIF